MTLHEIKQTMSMWWEKSRKLRTDHDDGIVDHFIVGVMRQEYPCNEREKKLWNVLEGKINWHSWAFFESAGDCCFGTLWIIIKTLNMEIFHFFSPPGLFLVIDTVASMRAWSQHLWIRFLLSEVIREFSEFMDSMEDWRFLYGELPGCLLKNGSAQ